MVWSPCTPEDIRCVKVQEIEPGMWESALYQVDDEGHRTYQEKRIVRPSAGQTAEEYYFCIKCSTTLPIWAMVIEHLTGIDDEVKDADSLTFGWHHGFGYGLDREE